MRKLFFAFLLVAASLPASAQWVVGGGYINVSDTDIRLGAAYGSVGYLMETGSNFSI